MAKVPFDPKAVEQLVEKKLSSLLPGMIESHPGIQNLVQKQLNAGVRDMERQIIGHAHPYTGWLRKPAHYLKHEVPGISHAFGAAGKMKSAVGSTLKTAGILGAVALAGAAALAYVSSRKGSKGKQAAQAAGMDEAVDVVEQDADGNTMAAESRSAPDVVRQDADGNTMFVESKSAPKPIGYAPNGKAVYGDYTAAVVGLPNEERAAIPPRMDAASFEDAGDAAKRVLASKVAGEQQIGMAT